MNTIRMVALALIIGGVLALVYGGFSVMRTTHEATLGSMHLKLTERETINVPLWAGIAAIAGGVMLLVGARK